MKAEYYTMVANGTFIPTTSDIKQYCEVLLAILQPSIKLAAYRCVEAGKFKPILGLKDHQIWCISILCLIDGIKYLDNYIMCRLPQRIDIVTGQTQSWSVEEALAEFPLKPRVL